MTRHAIVADIGGTNARFATVDLTETPSLAGLQQVDKLRCADYPSLTALLAAYLARLPRAERVGEFCICIAGAVEQDEIYMPNRGWTFSQAAVQQALGRPLAFINDFTAQVHSIATLQAAELNWLGTARPRGTRVFAVVGPGTGLGVGGMTAGHEAIPSEGGHIGFAPQNAHQAALLGVLWEKLPRVEVEKLISGPGLERLYWAAARLQGREASSTAPAVSAAAESGDPFARAVLQDFFDILAAYASDVAIMLGAVDGVYIVGDMMAKLRPSLDLARFRRCFDDKDNYQPYCSRSPLALVSAQDTGLRGCWQHLSLQASRQPR